MITADPRRLLVVGQVHGRYDTFDKIVNRAHVERADGIVALGNLFNRAGTTPRFLEHMTDRLAKFGVRLWFVDGPDDGWAGPGRLSEWVTMFARGETWSWGGVKFLAAGGGVTLHPVGGKRPMVGNWWPHEALSAAEVESIVEVGRVDVVLSFDAPWGVPVPHRLPSEQYVIDRGDMVREVDHRKALLRIVERCRPRQVLCAPGGRHTDAEFRVKHPSDRRYTTVRVDALGNPDFDDGCELLDILPPSMLDGASIHPALQGDGPVETEVEHPAL